MIQMRLVLFQIFCREGFSMTGINPLCSGLQNLFPGLPELRQILYPDNDPFPAGEAIHGGVSAEDSIFYQQGDMIRRMTGCFQYLKRQVH